ncbi:unnamed protein product [Moneuplotes crassus]|uniref:Uncharacterized protein n=1 Tax=Euplotes crassus TaxID=5936 RepID=A0AAD1Y2L8_EUPCR|nr:unnamed protein product [Moneuplotes crassus]
MKYYPAPTLGRNCCESLIHKGCYCFWNWLNRLALFLLFSINLVFIRRVFDNLIFGPLALAFYAFPLYLCFKAQFHPHVRRDRDFRNLVKRAHKGYLIYTLLIVIWMIISDNDDYNVFAYLAYLILTAIPPLFATCTLKALLKHSKRRHVMKYQPEMSTPINYQTKLLMV